MAHDPAMDLADRALAFRLASRLLSYPDEDVASDVAALREAGAGLDEPDLDELCEAFAALADGALEATYLRLFENGKERSSLHETEHGRMRQMSKGNDLADIAGFYAAFGLGQSYSELPDHVAVELEFYSVLLVKQAHLGEIGDPEGVSIVKDARRTFLRDHLGPLALAIAARLSLAEAPLYGPAGAYCGRLVAAELEALGVRAAPLDFFTADPDADEPPSCGSLGDGPLVGIKTRRS